MKIQSNLTRNCEGYIPYFYVASKIKYKCVDPATSQWYIAGQNGAEFRQLKKGQIVFNGDQTKELFRNGSINSRGIALANGTAGKLGS